MKRPRPPFGEGRPWASGAILERASLIGRVLGLLGPIRPGLGDPSFGLRRKGRAARCRLPISRRPRCADCHYLPRSSCLRSGDLRSRRLARACGDCRLERSDRTWLGLIAVLAWRLLRLRRRAVAWRWETVAGLARTMSVALFAVVAIGALPNVPSFTPQVVEAKQLPGPPIYVVLLDAYPRADALAEWGYDNEWFLKGSRAADSTSLDRPRRTTTERSTR